MNRLAQAVFLTSALATATQYDTASEIPRLPDGRFGCQAAVIVYGVSAKELYSRARAWVAAAYNSAPNVLKLDDPQSGKLIIKGVFPDSSVSHTVTIEFKDGKYRYALGDLIESPDSLNGYEATPLEKALGGHGGMQNAKAGIVRDEIRMLVIALTAAMQRPTPASSNW
jgi:Domain of unknown function (DUF4468) with TBP-like fold